MVLRESVTNRVSIPVVCQSCREDSGAPRQRFCNVKEERAEDQRLRIDFCFVKDRRLGDFRLNELMDHTPKGRPSSAMVIIRSSTKGWGKTFDAMHRGETFIASHIRESCNAALIITIACGRHDAPLYSYERTLLVVLWVQG